MSYIIEQVKRRRQERNWSQKYIADCINVSQSFIYKAVIYIFTLINVGFNHVPLLTGGLKKGFAGSGRLYGFYKLLSCFPANCPQAASMSFPLLRRTLTTMLHPSRNRMKASRFLSGLW